MSKQRRSRFATDRRAEAKSSMHGGKRHAAMPTEERLRWWRLERQRKPSNEGRLGEGKLSGPLLSPIRCSGRLHLLGKDGPLDHRRGYALSFGKSPSVVTLAAMKVHAGPDKDGLPPSPFALEYLKRTELARRSLAWKELYDPIIPTLFLRWAQRMDMKPPDELVAAVEARGLQVLDWKDEKEKERHDESKKRVVELEEYARVAKEGWKKLGAAGIGNAQALRDVRLTAATRWQYPKWQRFRRDFEEEAAKRPDELALSAVERNSLLRIIYGMATAVPYGFSPGAARERSGSDHRERNGRRRLPGD